MKQKTPKKVLQDWYKLDIKFSIELLEAFIDNVENQIKSSVRNFIDKKETLIIDEQPDLHYAQFVDIYNGLDSETWDLEGVFKEHFPNLQRRSAFVSLYSFLENKLDNLCILFRNKENYKIDLKELKGSGIDRSVLYLEKVCCLPIIKSDEKWGTVKEIQKIRHLIVHNNGNLSDKDSNPKNNEFKYVKRSEFLSKVNEVLLNEGFLIYTLKTFDNLFKHIDSLIQKKYEKIT